MKINLLIAFAIVLFFTASGFKQHTIQKPNIILVFIDDMGYSDLSCFGNQEAQTPNIDRLSSEGIAFESFYVNAPICSPSRVAISTGTYPQRWSITSYLGRREKNAEINNAQWLNTQAPMLARKLQQQGYRTGHFGKWHMGGQRDVTEAPPVIEYGFDSVLTNFEGIGPKLLPLTLTPEGEEGRIWADAEILEGSVEWMQRSEITAGFVDAAIAFIEHSNNQPFYINLWPDDVHTPHWPPIDKWRDRSKRARYLGVLETMDAQLGELFDYIRNNEKLRANTIILLCSDNGPHRDCGKSENFKGYKSHLYEGGIRSPLIVWSPGWIKENSVGKRNATSVFSAIDIVPSMLEIVKIKGTADIAYDGEDVSKTLLGYSDDSRKQPIFFSRPPDFKNSYGLDNLPDLAVRDGRWKLLCSYDGSNPQLYNIIEDEGETNDLSKEKIKVTKRLTGMVTDWYANISK